jgi:hypothetical protein
MNERKIMQYSIGRHIHEAKIIINEIQNYLFDKEDGL